MNVLLREPTQSASIFTSPCPPPSFNVDPCQAGGDLEGINIVREGMRGGGGTQAYLAFLAASHTFKIQRIWSKVDHISFNILCIGPLRILIIQISNFNIFSKTIGQNKFVALGIWILLIGIFFQKLHFVCKTGVSVVFKLMGRATGRLLTSQNEIRRFYLLKLIFFDVIHEFEGFWRMHREGILQNAVQWRTIFKIFYFSKQIPPLTYFQENLRFVVLKIIGPFVCNVFPMIYQDPFIVLLSK